MKDMQKNITFTVNNKNYKTGPRGVDGKDYKTPIETGRFARNSILIENSESSQKKGVTIPRPCCLIKTNKMIQF
ncbi:MAG: hypothetical protein M3162_03340 [Thermoproteota archaeon]|nr:hypothetical protein [Thermoproteota archaeon]